MNQPTAAGNAFAAFNAGSSSIKFSVFLEQSHELVLTWHGQIESIDTHPHFVVRDAAGTVRHDATLDSATPYPAIVGTLIDWIEHHLQPARLVAVGHRVVHGGDLFHGPALVTSAVLDQLDRLAPLAPLHQPHNLLVMRTMAALHPQLVQVASFDTAFHMSNSPLSRRYALPPELDSQGIRRYGFHGLSYQHIAATLPSVETRAGGKVVVAHLGNGASMCALHERRSVASTMGFSTLDGLPMGTRCGTIDPGAVLYLLQGLGWTIAQVEDLLYHHAGLAGMSGIGADMRQLLDSSDPHAREAVEVFCYRIARELGSLAAALGGLDVLVFTGGIGEHAAAVRARVGEQATWLGVELDPVANLRGAPGPLDAFCISTPASRVAVWVVPANEEIVIARQAQQTAALT